MEPSRDDRPSADSERDARGRFLPGNSGGPGNPRIRRQAEYQQAIRDAVKPEHLRLLMQKMIQLAVKDGDVNAARLVAERCLGRVNLDPVGDGIPIELPEIRSFESLLAATDVLLRAAVDGTAAPEVIERLARLVEGVRRVYETQELARRLEQAEALLRSTRDQPGFGVLFQ